MYVPIHEKRSATISPNRTFEALNDEVLRLIKRQYIPQGHQNSVSISGMGQVKTFREYLRLGQRDFTIVFTERDKSVKASSFSYTLVQSKKTDSFLLKA